MSKQATDWAEALPTLPTGVKPLLVHLARFTRKDTNTCFRAQETIAESIDQSISTVKRNVKWLRQNGMISTRSAYKNGVRVADEITLNVGATLGVNMTRSQVSNRPLKMATLGVKSDDLRCQKHRGQVSKASFPSLLQLTNQQNKHCDDAIAIAELKKSNEILETENQSLKGQIEALKAQVLELSKPEPIEVTEKPKRSKAVAVKTEKQQGNADTWNAYANAYFNRYGIEPLRNAQINTQISKFVDVVGIELAPVLARFYINLDTPFYLQKTHPVGLMITDAQAIRTQYLTGRQITRQDIKRVEQSRTSRNAIDELCAQNPNGEPW
jgi:hypothetical protein